MHFTGLDFEDIPFSAGYSTSSKGADSRIALDPKKRKNAVVLGLALLCIIVATTALLTLLPHVISDFEVVPNVASAAETTIDAPSTGNSSSSDRQSAPTIAQSAESAPKNVVFVHVAGQVVHPGVYELLEGDRVQSAVDAAGGFAKRADKEALNLAAVVSDGEQIVVPKKGESKTEEACGSLSASSNTNSGTNSTGASSTSPNAVSNGLIDINHATASELTALPGVGESTAAKIVADREANGPFSSPADIQRVSGIGAKKYESMVSMICTK